MRQAHRPCLRPRGLRGATGSGLSDEVLEARTQLAHLTKLINQTVGDAISDLLLVEAALIVLNLSLADWQAQYTDLPNRLAKVTVCGGSETGPASRCRAPHAGTQQRRYGLWGLPGQGPGDL